MTKKNNNLERDLEDDGERERFVSWRKIWCLPSPRMNGGENIGLGFGRTAQSFFIGNGGWVLNWGVLYLTLPRPRKNGLEPGIPLGVKLEEPLYWNELLFPAKKSCYRFAKKWTNTNNKIRIPPLPSLCELKRLTSLNQSILIMWPRTSFLLYLKQYISWYRRFLWEFVFRYLFIISLATSWVSNRTAINKTALSADVLKKSTVQWPEAFSKKSLYKIKKWKLLKKNPEKSKLVPDFPHVHWGRKTSNKYTMMTFRNLIIVSDALHNLDFFYVIKSSFLYDNLLTN